MLSEGLIIFNLFIKILLEGIIVEMFDLMLIDNS